MCSSLGGILGIPKVHYKGRQGDYYVMVGSQVDVLHEPLRTSCFHFSDLSTQCEVCHHQKLAKERHIQSSGRCAVSVSPLESEGLETQI